MLRKPNPRTLTLVFLAVSAALSVVLLAVRNLYDDEIFSLDLIRSSVSTILAGAAEGDVHPPGMYLLAHLAYLVVPSFRWMNLVPGLVLYLGLAVFLLQVAPLFLRLRAQLCLLLFATLHPQLLMWGSTFRWYSWWTGLALLVLTVALQPVKLHPVLGNRRAITLGVLCAALFYLNYITVFFLLALGAALVPRYRTTSAQSLFRRTLLALAVFLALVAPQLHTMLTVHLPNSRVQRYSPIVSVLRLSQSVVTSEAYLPWHPLALAMALVSLVLFASGTIAFVRRRQRASTGRTPPLLQSPLACIVFFGIVFFVLVALTGLGGKPRNGLLLVPVLAPAAALLLQTVRPRLQTALLVFFALWSSVGIAHLLGRYGLTKSMMTDRPEQVIAFLSRTRLPGQCAVVVTYDSALAFDLAQSRIPDLLIISPYRGPVFGGERALPVTGCATLRMYLVRSYLGGTATRAAAYNAELSLAESYLAPPLQQNAFSPDPDAPRKRRLEAFGPDLASVNRLPDLRYTVTSGLLSRDSLEPMRRRMPAFLSGYQSTVDEPPSPQR